MSWEVRTMPSATRSSDRQGWFSMALFRKNAVRFWPLWVGYGVLQFFILDMNLIQGWGFQHMDAAARTEAMRDWVMGCTDSAAVLGGGFGLLFAMALFSYLMNSKAVNFMHGLPIRREGLFFTNFSLGACFFLVPDLIVAVIALLAGAVWGVGLFGVTAAWLVSQVLVGLFFFSFAVCCAMFTGHILALPVFYGILNVLVAGLSVLTDATLNTLLVGYDGEGLFSSTFTRWCTPVWHLTNKLAPRTVYNDLGKYSSMELPGLTAALAYAFVLCAVFTSIALWVYHARELERAGDVVTVGWMRPVFQYGLGFCVGLAGGVSVYQTFFSRSGKDWVFIAFVALWAIVGAFAGRMFLKKTLRVFADGWKGPAVLGVCMFLLLAGVRMDLTGYQRWTPDAGQVKSISVSGVNSAPWDQANHSYLTLKDSGDIQAFLDFQKALVAHLDDLRGEKNYNYYDHLDENGYDTYAEKYLNVTYEMADGSIKGRNWDDIPITAEALDDPNSYAAKLQAFINRPNVVKALYRGDFMDDREISYEAVAGWLDNVRAFEYAEKYPEAEGSVIQYPETVDESLYVTDEMNIDVETQARIKETQFDLDAAEVKTLWAAVQKDMAAGDLGRRYLLDNKERYDNCYQTDLCLQFLYTFTNRDGERDSGTWTMEIALQKSATETLKALDDMGYTSMLAPWVMGEK